jgi:gliding motility-associated-like protein
MKKLLLLILLSISLSNVYAKHIKGGFFTYQYLGPGINNPSYLRYKIVLTVYMTCKPPPVAPQLDSPSINFTIFSGDGEILVDEPVARLSNEYVLSKTGREPCITNYRPGCFYTIATYELDNYELPVTANGYVISFQRCCRLDGVDNITNSGNVGNTYSILIPGTSSRVPNANKNSSPVFPTDDTIVVCENNYFEFPFTATDPDGDSLSYALCDAYPGGSFDTPEPVPADPPPYETVPYAQPYSGSQPMGPNVTINSATGLISGIAPSIINTGEYVVSVCVYEFRKGVYFASSRKELHILVKDCTPVKASILVAPFVQLSPEYSICNGYNLSFSNSITTPSGTSYSWNFGEPKSGLSDTSTFNSPTHLYSDTGAYTVKLKVSLGFCIDSGSSIVKVYPGFFAGFKTLPPYCIGTPVQFQDTSKTTYGSVTGWHWDFGNTALGNDTSSSPSPHYTYSQPGTYHAHLEVSNTKGCTDTVYSNVVILNNPTLALTPHDTTYCSLDTLKLTATGTGTFNWNPSTKITGANTSSPSVFPSVATKYIVTLNNAGCTSKDSAIVRPVNDLSTTINASSSQVCEEDTLTLTGISNHTPVASLWSPANLVLSPESQVTKAFPSSTTTYMLTTTWGSHCVAPATKTINVIELAVPSIAPDIPFCAGQGSEQLVASGGNNYQWTPAAYLSNPNIPNPVASPPVTTQYTVSEGVNGCTKRRTANVIVDVRLLPALALTDDTLICSIDTLQLTATGNGSIVWSPNYSISNTASSTPLVSPDVPTEYYARLTDAFGCYSDDSVFVDVRTYISVDAGNDTTICQTDAITLHPISDALQYIWSPSTYLSNPIIKHPVAAPLTNETYHVIANLGKCQAQDSITIRVVPYPDANAGNDTAICLGASVQLNGSGGTNYQWSPSAFLTAVNIPDPVSVSPSGTIAYILSVTDVVGCPKPSYDTVLINVFPKPNADAGPQDTTVVKGEPLQLNATGGDSYSWAPTNWLSNPNIADPIALPQTDIQYVLSVKTNEGCEGKDSINIKLYDVDPGLYVPNAFTPNGDGLNDNFKPILLGMKQLTYFRVYNRWGQLVYSSSVIGEGWDGTVNGQPQNSGNYIWMVEGINYKGQIIKKQGNVILIR